MYYNIKIKSNGSEFSLESNNKEVLQREMDLYFATIFNVSEEFKSNIKKIEITNKNVKSINEIEVSQNIEKPINQLSEERIHELAKIKAQEIIEAHKAKLAQEEKLKLELQNSIQQVPTNIPTKEITQTIKPISQEITQTANFAQPNIQNIEPALEINKPILKDIQPIAQEFGELAPETPTQTEAINQVQTSVVKFQNEPTQILANQVEITQIPSKLPDEILELINLAQKKIESIEKVSTTDISLNKSEEKVQNSSLAEEEPLTETEKNNQVKLNDIFNSATPNVTSQTPSEEPSIEISQVQQEVIEQATIIKQTKDEEFTTETPKTIQEPIFNDTIEVSLADIEVSLQPQEISQETLVDEKETEVQPVQSQIEQPQNNPDIIDAKPTEVSRIPLSQMASQIDFKPFLSGFICDGLSDEFLVCAYFIKNVLKQSDFTMKFINSKLFQATGKIADMSVIDELTTKEYIRTIDSEDGKKYSITMDGEGYFATKFQG